MDFCLVWFGLVLLDLILLFPLLSSHEQHVAYFHRYLKPYSNAVVLFRKKNPTIMALTHLILFLTHNTPVYSGICSSSALSMPLIAVCSCVCFVSPVFWSIVFAHSNLFQSQPYGLWHERNHSKQFLRVLLSSGFFF